jgi:hypothetical protein
MTIYDAINEIEDDLSIEPIERELQIGLGLKSVNVKDMLLNINTYKNMFTLGGIQEYLYNKLR